MKSYSIILADPPWPSVSTGARGNAADNYSLMTLDEIAQVPIPAAKDCALFLWVRSPALPEALTVMTAWGFRYVTVAFVWEKVSSCGEPMWACGLYTRPSTELCLLGMRGKLEVKAHDVGQVIRARRGQHSRKPDQQYDLIERLFGALPRIELFARREIVGWDCWGNQVGDGAAPSESQREDEQNKPAGGLDKLWEE
jgi:site-specific DNA-methyltransferase (adenine-specific)